MDRQLFLSIKSYPHVVWTPVYNHFTQKSCKANNSQHSWMLHVACVCTPCCIFLCVVGVLAQSLKPIKRLATCNGRNNCQEYWELLTYPIYDDPLSNRRGTALLRYSSSVNRSSTRHGLSDYKKYRKHSTHTLKNCLEEFVADFDSFFLM